MNALGVVSLVGMGVTGAALLALRIEGRTRRDGLRAARWFKAPLSAILFPLRRRIRLSRGAFALTPEPKDDLFAYLEGSARANAWARERVLRERFELAAFRDASSCEDYREVLYHLDVLDRLGATPPLPADGARSRLAIDVGSKDFRYALALERWARDRFGGSWELTGVEIDGNGLYRSLHARRDRAEAYCRAVGPHVRYRVADFLAFDTELVDLVTAFFPFVLPYAIVAWGLPLRHFAPERFFERYRDVLRPGGLLLIANHTGEERARTLELAARVGGLRLVSSGPMRSPLVAYQEEVDDRHVHVWVREP